MVATVKKEAPQWRGKGVVDGAIADMSSDMPALKGKWVILLFYPLDFTFVCPTELCAFSDRASEFAALGAAVVGVSVDSEYAHLKWTQTPRTAGGLAPFSLPLLADITKGVARSYGVLHDESVALRGLFIVDPSGVLRHATVNDLPVGRDVDEALRVLQALQFVDAHGEVCPANWRPGSKTMVADPVQSLKYFGARE